MTHRLEGGCHCGNIRYVYSADTSADALAVRTCHCSYCTKHNALYVSAPDSSLNATVLIASLVRRYEFGTKTARFLSCDKCGCMTLATSTIHGTTYAIVNANTLDDAHLLPSPVTVGRFDDELTSARLDRRKDNWIGNVSIRFVNT